MFINACFAATRQDEYYVDRYQQSVTIEFLHSYVQANYRRLYARAISAGINHFNQTLIVFNLLRAGAPTDLDQRAEEGELIRIALQGLPANRVFGLFKRLQKHRVNNRRTRAVIRDYLQSRHQPEFDAVKYRSKVRSIVAHAHCQVDREIGLFLFQLKKQKSFKTPLLHQFRAAHYSAAAIYELPFTVAEALAERHRVPRAVFLRKIAPKMTAAEKLRFQTTADRTKKAKLDFDLARASLTRLAIYVLSLPIDERRQRCLELDLAFQQSAKKTQSRSRLQLGRVAAILDHSRSSIGSRQKRNRPLAVALAASQLLRAAATEYKAFWTPGQLPENDEYEFLISARGQTSLASPLIDALEWGADLVIIFSDGFENDPPQAVDQVAAAYQLQLAGDRTTEIIHMNPVFDSNHYAPRPLGTSIPTVGLRDAEDIATMLGFARFASGMAPLQELEDYLHHRMTQFLLMEAES